MVADTIGYEPFVQRARPDISLIHCSLTYTLGRPIYRDGVLMFHHPSSLTYTQVSTILWALGKIEGGSTESQLSYVVNRRTHTSNLGRLRRLLYLSLEAMERLGIRASRAATIWYSIEVSRWCVQNRNMLCGSDQGTSMP